MSLAFKPRLLGAEWRPGKHGQSLKCTQQIIDFDFETSASDFFSVATTQIQMDSAADGGSG